MGPVALPFPEMVDAHTRRTDLAVTVAVTLVAVGVLLTPVGGALPRAVLAGLLVLFLPGYALAAAIYPPRTLSAADRAAMVIAFGIATTVLMGIGLDLTPFGIVSRGYVGGLGAVALVSSVAAWARTGSAPASRQSARIRFRGRQVLLLALAVLVAAGAVTMSRRDAETRSQQTAFTGLWMVQASDSSSRVRIRVGVNSHEKAVTRFRLKVVQGGRVVHTWNSIELPPGGSWSADFGAGRRAEVVRADLYRIGFGNSAPYRTVHVWPGGGAQ
jgi:hypothetical protein